jgi:hypothetical protein
MIVKCFLFFLHRAILALKNSSHQKNSSRLLFSTKKSSLSLVTKKIVLFSSQRKNIILFSSHQKIYFSQIYTSSELVAGNFFCN